MVAVMLARPGWVAVFVIAALVVLPAALLLTVGRGPSAEIPGTPARPDGCVMFCPDVNAAVAPASMIEGGDR